MKVDKHEDGFTSWMDLASDDVESSVDFYCGLFGWEALEGSPETGGYRQCLKDGEPVAGLGSKMAPGQPTVWTIYVQSSDIDATVARAVELGGTKVAGPMDAMEFGRLAVVADPVGAAIGLWQPNEMMGMRRKDEHGSWAWSELMTSDLDSSETFYTKLFGWSTAEHAAGNPAYREMKMGESFVAGLMARTETMPADVPNYWCVYFTVDSIDDAVGYLNEHGAKIVIGPAAIEPGQFLQFIDPQGAVVGLLEPKRP